MNRSRVRVAVVVVPALLIGAVLGEWVGGRLFSAPGSTADGPAGARPLLPIEVTVELPSAAALPSGAPAPFTPAPSSATSQSATGQGPGEPGQPQPGNPGGGSGNGQPPPTTATTTPAAPQPAWGPRLDTSIQVVGFNSTQVGRAQGWFQMHSDRRTFRYSFTFCRQSSYMLPYLAVAVNGHYVGQTWQSTPITTIYPSYAGNSTAQPCYGSTATVSNEHGYATIQNVYFRLHGSTFNGSEHVISTQDRTFYNSN